MRMETPTLFGNCCSRAAGSRFHIGGCHGILRCFTDSATLMFSPTYTGCSRAIGKPPCYRILLTYSSVIFACTVTRLATIPPVAPRFLLTLRVRSSHLSSFLARS